MKAGPSAPHPQPQPQPHQQPQQQPQQQQQPRPQPQQKIQTQPQTQTQPRPRPQPQPQTQTQTQTQTQLRLQPQPHSQQQQHQLNRQQTNNDGVNQQRQQQQQFQRHYQQQHQQQMQQQLQQQKQQQHIFQKQQQHQIQSQQQQQQQHNKIQQQQQQNQQYIQQKAPDGSNKRRAQYGQWRTPPQPVFPSVVTTNTNHHHQKHMQQHQMQQQPQQQQQQQQQHKPLAQLELQQQKPMVQTPQMPIVQQVRPQQQASQPQIDPRVNNNNNGDSSNKNNNNIAYNIPPGVDPLEYAALQEAYRRGAEAAVALTSQPGQISHQALFAAGFADAQKQQQDQQLHNSCPDLANLTLHPQPQVTQSQGQQILSQQHQPTAQPQHQQQPVFMPIPPQKLPHLHQQQPRPPQPQQITIPFAANSANTPTATNVNVNATSNHQQQLNSSTTAIINDNNNAPRSMSLPDISRYAARATAEENKRKKRLARNRASARLRRLKKKNLVDTYEGEVGVLEASLAKLHAHSWGEGHDHEALLEALSMDRGQQVISPEARQEFIRDILKQQQEQIDNIMDVHLEVELLHFLANYDVRNDKNSAEDGKTSSSERISDDKETAQLAEELNSLLKLTHDQKARLRVTTQTCPEERRAIETVDECLRAMLDNDWIMNNSVEECTRDFMSILNPGQVCKFLLWTDHNSDAIDQLDYVNAPPASAPPANSPMFIFGTDSDYCESNSAQHQQPTQVGGGLEQYQNE